MEEKKKKKNMMARHVFLVFWALGHAPSTSGVRYDLLQPWEEVSGSPFCIQKPSSVREMSGNLEDDEQMVVPLRKGWGRKIKALVSHSLQALSTLTISSSASFGWGKGVLD